MRNISLVFTILFTSILGYANPLGPSHPLLGYSTEVIIPFDYQQGFMIVDMVVGRALPLKFILDTGAENTVIFKKDIADVLRLPYHKKITLQGSDLSEEINAFVSNGLHLQLVNCQTIRKNIIVLETNYLVLEQFLGKQVDGILGADILEGLVMKIDYQYGEITLINPHYGISKIIKNHQKFDIDIADSKPYLNCEVEVVPNKRLISKMLLDTGAGLTFMLHNNTDTLLKLPENIVKGNLGKGLGGDIEGFFGRAHRLGFGPFEFRSAFCNFQEIDIDVLRTKKIIRNGLIGNLLLERFSVIIDFSDKKLYLKSKKNYNKEFEYDKSGLLIFAFGPSLNRYFIKEIIEGSPAQEAGLAPGDIIVKINRLSTKFYTLKLLNRKFVGKVGRKIKVKVNRNGEYLVKEVVLRDLF